MEVREEGTNINKRITDILRLKPNIGTEATIKDKVEGSLPEQKTVRPVFA